MWDTAPSLKSKPWLAGVGLGAVALLGLVDFLTGPELSFALFYLVPVLVVSWYVGRNAGLVIALASGLACFMVESAWHLKFSLPWAPYFNFLSRSASLAIVSVLVSRMREQAGRLEESVQARTAQLEHQIDDRRRAEEKSHARDELFRQLAESINEVFWMTDANRKQLVYVSPAYERIWGHSCASLFQSPTSWLDAIHPEDRQRVAAALIDQPPGEYNVQYRILRPDGSLRWISDRAFPILDAEGKLYRIAGIAADITAAKQTELALVAISDREQARIGLDLHDGLCQLLVSIAFDTNLLQQRLETARLAEAADAARIAALLDDSITQARQLARGLYPVRLEAEGLGSALEELAANVTHRFKLNCQVECVEAVAFRDQSAATHLYRIAQEAVSNAVRHARAEQIRIRFARTNGKLELAIADNGSGIPAQRQSQGMGLQIMDYRARTLGGTLQIHPAKGGGTVVCCRVPWAELITVQNS